MRKPHPILVLVVGLSLLLGVVAALTLHGDDSRPKINTGNTPHGEAPDGMVWIPGGQFYMGIADADFPDANIVHPVYVDGFWMDKTEVTNEQYAKFVEATKFLTDAEKTINPRDYPEVRASEWTPEKLQPFSIVFRKPPPNASVDLHEHSWWQREPGASWQHPEGPNSTIQGQEKYPVVHISYNDAVAYCKWARRRLPTEAEWEFAARGGLDRKLFPWGDEKNPDGKWRCNIWQGNFPVENTKEDGFEGTAPVASYPANAFGLHDMSGNVWEWCADWYQTNYYRKSPRRNPQGPDSGMKRVQRGGSFLCADSYCARYLLGTRGSGDVRSAANHTGFRCVMDAK